MTPSIRLSSVAVAVTPSSMFNSAAVDVIEVPAICKVVALNVPVTAALPPTERSSVIVASSVEVNCSA